MICPQCGHPTRNGWDTIFRDHTKLHLWIQQKCYKGLRLLVIGKRERHCMEFWARVLIADDDITSSVVRMSYYDQEGKAKLAAINSANATLRNTV